MKTTQTIAAAAVGTTVMTLFSYLISSSKKKNFVEPERLSGVVQDMVPEASKEEAQAVGWSAHYAVGLTFAGLFALVWEKTPIKPSLVSGAVLGAASGVVGAAGWMGSFTLDPKESAKNHTNYYGHLILAHVVFGMGAAVGYKLLGKKKKLR